MALFIDTYAIYTNKVITIVNLTSYLLPKIQNYFIIYRNIKEDNHELNKC